MTNNLDELAEQYASSKCKNLDYVSWHTSMPEVLEVYKDAYLAALESEEVKALVEALEWYDGVHRLHWAINLNDLSVKAEKALKAFRGEK